MNSSLKIRLTGMYQATTFTIFIIGSVIIASEVSASIHQILASLTGNQWLTVSILTVIIYVLLLVFFSLLARYKRIPAAIRPDNPLLWSAFLIIITLLMIVSSLVILIMKYHG